MLKERQATGVPSGHISHSMGRMIYALVNAQG